MTTIIVLVFIAVAAVLLHWWSSRVDTSGAHGPPPLFYPLESAEPPASPVAEPTPPPRASTPPSTAAASHGNGALHVRPEAQAQLHPPHVPAYPTANGNGNGNGGPHAPHSHMNGNGVRHPAADRPMTRPGPVDAPRMQYHSPPAPLDVVDDDSNAETIRFIRPTDLDTAVQLLPGRLEVLEGATPHREIRFMRVPGEAAHIVLGREVRLTPHYIGLGSPMVSRRHAQFEFTNSRWHVRNLSHTNPLVVNGDELFDTDVARPLADGDRLELGDVVLRFHSH